MEWIDAKTIYTIGHLFGVALGAGGAFVSDVLFLFSTKDKVLDDSEYKLLVKASGTIWIGLALLVVSGALLFAENPAGYLSSSKFLIKMIIVGVIFVNGIIFHFVHLKTLREIIGSNMAESELFKKKSIFLYASGGVSITSWTLALILGALRGIPLSVSVALLFYVVACAVAITVAQIKRHSYLRS